MAYAIDISHVSALPLAVLRVRATAEDLIDAIPFALDRVRDALARARSGPLGQNVAYYPNGMALFSTAGAIVECGVQMPAPYMGAGEVMGARTPAGAVAHTVHWGDYAQLIDAHRALHAYCRDGGHKITGVNWEVYGEWSEDPLQRRTDIYYQLA